MKTAYLEAKTMKATFQQLKLTFGGDLTVNYKEFILKVDSDFGKGVIKGVPLQDGISYLEFNMVFSHDLVLSINTPDKNPIYFTYCSKGQLGHSFGQTGEKRILESFQTGILTSRKAEANILYFKKNVPLNTTLISVQTSGTSQSDSNGLKAELRETFFANSTADNFVYIGSHNLKISEKIEQLNAITQEGLVRSLLVQGLVHVILALEIQQHSDDLNNRKENTGSLTVTEMETLKEVSRFVNDNSESQITITQLYNQFGLSPSKLQEGFKLMHGHTVTEYIREVRIKKAEVLLKRTDMNISEVVYTIGLTSRSYFSKIFKEKYNCSPKDYKFAQRDMAISA
ncbi:AraC family transcriptional regulator [Bizionia argentinensis JUB59]|uniref:AraC family transcriptional regulator n=1 Tax=Bizionia argentinensis JUB59 TaxID=1046627 RepID=G2EB47_9FLAO|nr:AraC family transcriptional regulator [Bizionia argentinensis]EGV44408.2 AraC family transcriptional regulator [Bizionia argentinensis JUB59]